MIENCVSLPEQEQASRQPQQLPAFTPGPWEAAISMAGIIAVFAGKHSNHILATVRDPYGEDKSVADANAHLIAAAPDMYAALQDCLEHCEKEGGPDVEFIRDDNSGHMLNVEMIRAALRKARGEQ